MQKPSKFHNNRKSYNWLIYDIGDKWLLEYSKYYKNTLVDLGCGTAPYKDFFLEYADKYVGVDWTKTLHNSQADVISNLNEKIKLPDNYADTIVSLSVMEHLCEPQIFLNESYRILKDGGIMILQVPWMWWIHELPHDYFRYTQHSINMLSKFGFEVKNVTPLGSRRETLDTTWFHFIKRTMDEYENSEKKLPFRYKLVFKFLNFVFLFLSLFIDKLKKANESDPLFTLGYGFVLIKRKD